MSVDMATIRSIEFQYEIQVVICKINVPVPPVTMPHVSLHSLVEKTEREKAVLVHFYITLKTGSNN